MVVVTKSLVTQWSWSSIIIRTTQPDSHLHFNGHYIAASEQKQTNWRKNLELR